MGMFDNLGGAAGAGADWAKQAADAQAMADLIMKDSGYGATTADAVAAAPQMAADQKALQDQADEQNRILTVGGKAKITIVSKTDLGTKVAGNDTYQLELEVVPEGGTAYTVKKVEIIPPPGQPAWRPTGATLTSKTGEARVRALRLSTVRRALSVDANSFRINPTAVATERPSSSESGTSPA